MSGPGHPTVTVPLEGWRHILRRVRQLEVLSGQQQIIVASLVDTIGALPDESGES